MVQQHLAGLRDAVGFLTVAPIPGAKPPVADSNGCNPSMGWFPWVGWVVGAMPALVLVGARQMGLPDSLAAALALTSWLVMTGFLHFDGLLDSADALLAPVSVVQRLKILRDVHHGSFAVAVGGCWLLSMYAALSAPGVWMAALLAPVAARAALLVVIVVWPHGRPGDSGVAANLGRPGVWGWLLAVAGTLPVLVLAPWAALASLLVMVAASKWSARRLGGVLTGDAWGAAVCLGELGFMVASTAAPPIWPPWFYPFFGP